jgi:hypothetical protein
VKKGKGSEFCLDDRTEASLGLAVEPWGKTRSRLGDSMVKGWRSGWIRFDVAIWGSVEGGEPEMERDWGWDGMKCFQT